MLVRMYVVVLTVLYATVYLLLYKILPTLFNQPIRSFERRQLLSVGLVIAAILVVHVVSFSIADEELSNRLLHLLGGGALAFAVCIQAIRDSRLQLNTFQVIVLSGLIVTALGVGNELLEYTLQRFTSLTFAYTIEDTWLDLVSNTAGIALAVGIYLPLIALRRPTTLRVAEAAPSAAE